MRCTTGLDPLSRPTYLICVVQKHVVRLEPQLGPAFDHHRRVPARKPTDFPTLTNSPSRLCFLSVELRVTTEGQRATSVARATRALVGKST